jgi:methionyl-tRNA synthetase
VSTIRTHHEAREFRHAAAETRALWAAGNAYVQAAAPWSSLRKDRPLAAVATRTALALIEVCATVAWSIIPNLATSAITAVGGEVRAGPPPWPDDVADLLLNERRAGVALPSSFAPVAKLSVEASGFAGW